MKIQDIAFIVFFIFLLYKHNAKFTVISGLTLLFLSIPLFFFQVFFTAERFTWYAAACLILAVGLSLKDVRKN